MKKAANVLYIVGFWLCLACAIFLLAPSPVLFVLGVSSKINGMVVEAIQQYAQDQSVISNAQLFADLMQAGFIVLSVLFILIGLACVVNAIVVSRARKEQTRGLYIASIILGAFSTSVTILAGIFSLIEDHKTKQIEE